MSTASSNQSLPNLISLPRITTLVASLLVTLSSGTNYVYSAYAPQLASRLNVSHTQINIIGIAGNVGVYCSGPLWGRIVDARGPRIPLVGAFACLLAGYSGIRFIYDVGVPDSASVPSVFSFYALILCSLLTGIGGSGGLNSSVNSTAKTFPDRARATTTGFVLSGFGLSAFLFSTIAHLAFASNTSSFLLLLSLGTSLPMILGFFFIRPIPLPPSEMIYGPEYGTVDADRGQAETSHVSAIFQDVDDSHTRLLDHDESEETYRHASNPPIECVPNALARSFLEEEAQHRSQSSTRSTARAAKRLQPGPPNISGTELLSTRNFWLLFTLLSLLSGTGLMYINNVGSMSLALYIKGNPSYDEVQAARWQATQVSSISIMNSLGRFLMGLVSDFSKNSLGFPRSYCLVLVSCLFFISQVAAANVDNLSNLWKVSASLGLAYGSIFGLFPTVCIEWFGLPHFSENWGYLSLSPAGYLFSVAFGRIFDAHEEAQKSRPHDTSAVPPSSHRCLGGRQCYVDALYITIAACLLAVVLSVYAAWRDSLEIAAAERTVQRRPEVVWADVED